MIAKPPEITWTSIALNTTESKTTVLPVPLDIISVRTEYIASKPLPIAKLGSTVLFLTRHPATFAIWAIISTTTNVSSNPLYRTAC